MLASTAAPQKRVGSRGRASGGGEDLPGKDGAAVAMGAPRLSGPWDGALSGPCDRTAWRCERPYVDRGYYGPLRQPGRRPPLEGAGEMATLAGALGS